MTLPVPGVRSATELRGHELRSESWSRTSNQPGQSRLANRRWSPLGMEPSPGADPGLLPYKSRVTAVCDGRAPAQAMAVASASRTERGSPCLRRCWVSSVRFERTLRRTQRRASAIGLRGRGASGRPRTAYLPRTKGPLCRVSYRGVATGTGIEPVWPRFRALMGCQQPTRYR